MFAALYVKPCSENRVNHGVWCAGAVQGLAFALFSTVFAEFSIEPCFFDYSSFNQDPGGPFLTVFNDYYCCYYLRVAKRDVTQTARDTNGT